MSENNDQSLAQRLKRIIDRNMDDDLFTYQAAFREIEEVINAELNRAEQAERKGNQ